MVEYVNPFNDSYPRKPMPSKKNAPIKNGPAPAIPEVEALILNTTNKIAAKTRATLYILNVFKVTEI